MLPLAVLEFLVDLHDHLPHEDLLEPLGQHLGLADPFVRFLRSHLLLVLEHVSLDQVPVLELLFLKGHVVSSLLHLLSLLLILELLDLRHGDAEAILLSEYMQHVALLLLHLELELAQLFLLLLHLFAQLAEGVCLWVLRVVRSLDI